MKQNDEHQDEVQKNVFGVSPLRLSRAISFILSMEPLVVVSLVPRPYLYWSGYETNLPTWI